MVLFAGSGCSLASDGSGRRRSGRRRSEGSMASLTRGHPGSSARRPPGSRPHPQCAADRQVICLDAFRFKHERSRKRWRGRERDGECSVKNRKRGLARAGGGSAGMPGGARQSGSVIRATRRVVLRARRAHRRRSLGRAVAGGRRSRERAQGRDVRGHGAGPPTATSPWMRTRPCSARSTPSAWSSGSGSRSRTRRRWACWSGCTSRNRQAGRGALRACLEQKSPASAALFCCSAAAAEEPGRHRRDDYDPMKATWHLLASVSGTSHPFILKLSRAQATGSG